MQAIEFTAYGDPGAIHLVEKPDPEAGAGEVVVALEAVPLNPSDFMMLSGHYGVRPDLPSGVGVEGVGRVIEVGEGVTSVGVGDRVVVVPSTSPGTWAERIVLPARFAVPVGEDADVEQLAMTGINALTALLVLRYGAPHAPGAWVAQTAANSGLGAYVRALAGRQGFRVLDVVRRQEAAEELRARGAEHVVVSDGSLEDRVREELGDDRIALVLDGVGGETAARLAPFVQVDGDIVSYSALSGAPLAIHPLHLNFQSLHLHGFWLNTWLTRSTDEEIADAYRRLVPLVADGTLAAAVTARYPLGEWRRALQHAEGFGRDGKVLFTMGAAR